MSPLLKKYLSLKWLIANPAFEWDGAKARRPSTLRSAS